MSTLRRKLEARSRLAETVRGAAIKGKSKMPHLFNTILGKHFSAAQRKAFATHSMSLEYSDVKYARGPDVMPASFDPYDETPVGAMSAADIARWYISADNNGGYISVISAADDQGGCGACWAFSAASMFSSRIRAALVRRFGQQACLISSFFHKVDYCTGETGVESPEGGGVVNVNPAAIYGLLTRNRISPYYTAAFAPEPTQTCGATDITTCIDNTCRKALMVGSGVTGHTRHADLHVTLGSDYSDCQGCNGNGLVMPMVLYTGSVTNANKGAAAISDFGVFDWACIFGDAKQQALFCPAGASKGQVRLFMADSYIYVTSDLFGASPGLPSYTTAGGLSRNVTDMETFMMCEIYNYGPIEVSYNVYDSFQQFFNKHTSTTYDTNAIVYTADQFLADIQHPATATANAQAQGGHAVMLFGWGTTKNAAGDIVRFWRILNSWGTGWGNAGTFSIERRFDDLLAAAGASQQIALGQEFATVYIAPDPNPAAYPGGYTNDMSSFARSPPYTRCPVLSTTPAEAAQLNAECQCPNNKCVPVTNTGNTEGLTVAPAGRSGDQTVLLVLLILVFVLLALVVAKKSCADAKAAQQSALLSSGR